MSIYSCPSCPLTNFFLSPTSCSMQMEKKLLKWIEEGHEILTADDVTDFLQGKVSSSATSVDPNLSIRSKLVESPVKSSLLGLFHDDNSENNDDDNNHDSAKECENDKEKECENDLLKISARRTIVTKEPRKTILDIAEINNSRVIFFYCLLFIVHSMCH